METTGYRAFRAFVVLMLLVGVLVALAVIGGSVVWRIFGGVLLVFGAIMALGALGQAMRQTHAWTDLPESVRTAERRSVLVAWIGVTAFLAVPIIGLLLLVGMLP